jgi:hypothetical protein
LPDAWQLETGVDVMLDEEPLYDVAPDIVVFDGRVSLTTRPIRAAEVLLVVEVVSWCSRREDRGSKPLAYAEAGIEWYWRLESALSDSPVPVLHVHQVVADRSAYREVQRQSGSGCPQGPFPVALDLSRLG